MHPTIKLELDGDGAFADLADKVRAGEVLTTHEITVACLKGGMQSGAVSIMFRFDLTDGRVILAETSYAALYTTMAGIAARYGKP